MTENTNITPTKTAEAMEATEQTMPTPEATEKKQACLNKLLNTYKQKFDMEMAEDSDIGLVAIAHYMEKASKGRFAFMKAERHEYVYIFDLVQLDKESFTAAVNFSLEDGIDRIQPTKGHLNTFITVVILADDVDAESKNLVIKNRYMRSLKRQKKGYINQRVCSIDFGKNDITNNKDANILGEFLKNFFEM